MGPVLAKPVMTQVEDRHGNTYFRCGSCCINGYRESMEDAHLVMLDGEWAFFAVFDGHVNGNCSQYLEKAWEEALKKETFPISDDRMKEIGLQVDQTWMNTGQDGGSTGTFFCAMKKDNTVHLQVGNVGDSRVLVCKNGEAIPMTEDHKPDNDMERERIEEFGGRVDNNRVDGSLAVSRAFGDRDYKQNSSGGQLEQKVIALADVTHIDLAFGGKDFAVLCCDGVFESNFTSEEVIHFIKEELDSGENDLGEVAGKVCQEAVARGSRDNISCVIVQFANGEDYSKEPHRTVVPGGFYLPHSSAFLKVYEMMATTGGTTVQDVLERRYDFLKAHENESDEYSEELQNFKDGPPANLTGAERTQWFYTLFHELDSEGMREGRSEQLQRMQLLQQQVGVPLPILLSLFQPGAQ